MLNTSWPMSAELLVSRGVPACPDSVVVDYRDRQFVNRTPRGLGAFDDEGRVIAATSYVTFAHLTVNPLVPRPRAKHG